MDFGFCSFVFFCGVLVNRCEAAFICLQEGGQDRWKRVAFAWMQGALPSGVSRLSYPRGGIKEF